jgi:benzoyl-CoA reductase/2-hydroxyglutaryl-CoA dehydratase subunit BcrC/BadD/HgdB
MPESDSAAKQLAWHYENPMAQAIAAHRAGIPVVALTSNTIPWELIQAAGLFPVMLRPARRATPAADEYMETDVFQARIRQIFESAVSGEWSFLSAIILSRTSEQEYKLFLYLREVARESPREGMPPVYLYDLLHSQSAETRAYGISRTEELKHQLEAIAGRRIDASDLAQAIAESNAARAAVRRLLALRQDAVRLAGTEALPLVGAYWFMARPEYAKLATEAADIIRQRQTLQGVRLIVKGAPLDHVQLHAVLESHGAIVVAEDDWWGTRSVGSDIEASGDPVKAIFEHCPVRACFRRGPPIAGLSPACERALMASCSISHRKTPCWGGTSRGKNIFSMACTYRVWSWKRIRAPEDRAQSCTRASRDL